MKLLHTADLHIGQDYYHNSRSAEHQHFFSQLADIVSREQPDVWIVSGDVFHTAAPSAEATELYTHALVMMHEACPTMQIVITAGNHDSPSRLQATREVWQLIGANVIGLLRHDIDDHIIPVGDKGYVLAVPYYYMRRGEGVDFFRRLTARVAELNHDDRPVVMTAHCYITGSDITGHDDQLIGGLDEVALSSIGEGYDYLAAGHIHCPQTLGYPISDEAKAEQTYPSGIARYAGSALHVNFDEAYPHSVSIVEIDRHGGDVHLRRIPIHQLCAMKSLCREHPLPLDGVLDQLRDYHADRPTYLCLHVAIERYLESGAEDRVMRLLEEKGESITFCDFVLHRTSTQAESNTPTIGYHDLRRMRQDPIELARLYYTRQHGEGSEMPDDMAEMLQEICANIKD